MSLALNPHHEALAIARRFGPDRKQTRSGSVYDGYLETREKLLICRPVFRASWRLNICRPAIKTLKNMLSFSIANRITSSGSGL